MPQFLKDFIDTLSKPEPFSIGSVVLVVLALRFRRIASHPLVFGVIALLTALFFVLAWDDPNFNKIVTKPDNVPIVILLASVGFLSWLALRRMVLNDERVKRGEPTLEGEYAKQKVFTWPDLVYTELICLVVFTALLIIWSILIGAPIEEPAALARTPNPSKAPWYFLGLQELLVYFDPWIAGVLLPGFIILGLCAVPYLDRNPRGNGYYTFEQRPFAISFFALGFLVLWVALIIMGTFLRGPNWSFFGPFEYWDHNKLEPMTNVDLSALVWIKMLGVPRPANILLRELPGILLLLGYFVLLPPVLGATVFRKLAAELGAIRFNVFMHLFLWFVLVPIKMGLRWGLSLKYIVGIPEWFFNV